MAKLGNPQETIQVLQKHDFHFQKKFGQNFLIDPHVLDKIIEAAEVTKDDFVLEIGPGIGTMTQYLACAARKVVAVEIDKALIPILEDTLSDYDNARVINNDVLKVDIEKLAEEENGGKYNLSLSPNCNSNSFALVSAATAATTHNTGQPIRRRHLNCATFASVKWSCAHAHLSLSS